MRRFFIELTDEAFERLTDAAERDRRPSRDHAAWLLEVCLQRERGALANALPEARHDRAERSEAGHA